MANRGIGRVEGERRRGLVLRWRRSGLSAAEFAQRHGLGKWALYSWAKVSRSEREGAHRGRVPARRLRQSAPGATARRGQDFLPVRLVGEVDAVAPVAAEGLVEIRLRGGDVVRLMGEIAADRVRAVVEALRQAC